MRPQRPKKPKQKSLLQSAKEDLRITHNEDDSLLIDYVESALDEVNRYLEEDFSEEDLPPAVRAGVLLMIRGMYEAVEPSDIEIYTRAMQSKVQSYRVSGIGI